MHTPSGSTDKRATETKKNPVLETIHVLLWSAIVGGAVLKVCHYQEQPRPVRDLNDEAVKALNKRETEEAKAAAEKPAAEQGAIWAMIYKKKPTMAELEKEAERAYDTASAGSRGLNRSRFMAAYKDAFANSYDYAYRHNVAPAF